MDEKKGKPMEATGTNENLSPMQMEILKKWQSKKKVDVPQEVKDQLQLRFDGEVLFDEPMSRHTYIKVGGPAEVFLRPKNKEALLFAVQLAIENNIPYYFHGSGANTLVKDGGIKGFVISVYKVLDEHEVLEQTDDYIDIRVDAGMSWVKLVHLSRDLGAADLAPMTGIPGSVGGLIAMNAGTGVREIKDVVREITVLNKEGEEKNVSRERLDFEYRNLKLSKTNFILSAVLRLQDLTSTEDVAQLIKQYQDRRSETQPLDAPNLGSMFKNPLPKHKNDVVASAGKLIEEAGLKNVRIGGARISQKHANFIINEEGEAQAKDVIALMNMIRDRVKTASGVVLEPEIKVIGEED